MALAHPENIYMAVPLNQIDQIIGIQTGSFSISAPTLGSPTTASDSFSTAFGDNCLFQGIFSTDSGATWNDFGVYRPNLSTPAQPVLQTVSCFGYVSSGGTFVANGLNWYDSVHSKGTAYTIQYKVVFFAKDAQSSLTPIATNEILQYDSRVNYQKIDLSDSFANSSSNKVVAHGLGYVPKVRSWFVPTSSTSGSEGVLTFPGGSMTTFDFYYSHTTVTVDTSNVTFSPVKDNVGALAGTVYYRIYLDS